MRIIANLPNRFKRYRVDQIQEVTALKATRLVCATKPNRFVGAMVWFRVYAPEQSGTSNRLARHNVVRGDCPASSKAI